MPRDTNASTVPTETSNEAVASQQPTIVSHLPKSFRRQFSQKVSSKETNKTGFTFQPSLLSAQEPSPSKDSFDEEVGSSLLPTGKLSEVQNDENCSELNTSAGTPLLDSPVSQGKKIGGRNTDIVSSDIDSTQTTPAKQVLTPARLVKMTTSLNPEKKCRGSPDDDVVRSPNKLVRRPPRSLKFDTPVKDENIENKVNDIGGASDEDDLLDILPKNLLQSVSAMICFQFMISLFLSLFLRIKLKPSCCWHR